MRGTNRVFLIGRLGKDPELRITRAGMQVVRLSLATNRWRRTKDGQGEEITDWHRVVVFRDLAEHCVRHLRKGSMVSVEGAVTYDKWTDAEGHTRYFTEIQSDRVNFLADMRTREEVLAEA